MPWLLASDEPAVRFQTRRDLLGEEAPEDAARVLQGRKVRLLLSEQRPDGGFGVHPYRKWTGAHFPPGSTMKVYTMTTALSQHISIDSYWDGPPRGVACWNELGPALTVVVEPTIADAGEPLDTVHPAITTRAMAALTTALFSRVADISPPDVTVKIVYRFKHINH